MQFLIHEAYKEQWHSLLEQLLPKGFLLIHRLVQLTNRFCTWSWDVSKHQYFHNREHSRNINVLSYNFFTGLQGLHWGIQIQDSPLHLNYHLQQLPYIDLLLIVYLVGLHSHWNSNLQACFLLPHIISQLTI